MVCVIHLNRATGLNTRASVAIAAPVNNLIHKKSEALHEVRSQFRCKKRPPHIMESASRYLFKLIESVLTVDSRCA